MKSKLLLWVAGLGAAAALAAPMASQPNNLKCATIFNVASCATPSTPCKCVSGTGGGTVSVSWCRQRGPCL